MCLFLDVTQNILNKFRLSLSLSLSLSLYSHGPPHMAVQKQDDQHENTFSNYVRIQDVVLKTCLRRWTIGKSGERGSGISVLPARHDDDDDIYIYIYIYIYISDCHSIDKAHITPNGSHYTHEQNVCFISQFFKAYFRVEKQGFVFHQHRSLLV